MLKLGSILQGRYRVLRLLGSGGFGAVYQAEDLRLASRPVAIKHFYTAHLPAAEAAEMASLFQSEAHTLARLNHPSLAQVFDYFSEGEDWFLVMEFVPGETIATSLQRLGDRPLEEAQIIEWGIELCQVLEHLHSRQPPLIFRDLKPANIMLTPDQRVILIDFGIVRSYKQGQAQDTFQMGTPGYAPPEQYGGQTEPRSDIYSLGATLYTLLAGERPTGELFNVPQLRERAPWVSPALAELIAQMTAYQLEDRPPSALAVRRRLETIRSRPDHAQRAQPAPAYTSLPRGAGSRGAGAAVLPLSQPVAPVRQRWSGLLMLLTFLLVVLAAAAALYASGLLPAFSARSAGSSETIAGGAERGAATPESEQETGAAATPGSGVLVSTSPADAEKTVDSDIALISLETGTLQRLVAGPTYDVFPSRRADGRLIFTRVISDEQEHICTAEADGSNVRCLTEGASINRAASWSPDGTMLAFESNRHSGSTNERDVFVMQADGSNPRRLTHIAGWQGGPAWSPDGRFIVFHSNESGPFHLSIVNVATGEVRTLAGLPDANLHWPSWSPNGETISFMADPVAPPSAPDRLYSVSAAGGSPTLLDVGPGRNRWPRWSPDGALLAFESNRDGVYHVYLYATSDGSVRPISSSSNEDRWPGW